MADIPTPTTIGAYLDDVVDAVAKVRDLYRWAHPNAWAPPNHGRSRSRSASRMCSKCRGAGRVDVPRADRRVACTECGGAGAVFASTDRVGAQVVATEQFRRFIRHAAREIVDGRNRLLTAVADLNDALGLLEPPPGPAVADVRFIPHPADAGDVQRAREAQERRRRRAEASRTWREVSG